MWTNIMPLKFPATLLEHISHTMVHIIFKYMYLINIFL